MLQALLFMTAALSTFSIDTTNEDVSARAAQLRYDALEPRGKRKTPRQTIAREDIYLRGGKRTKLQANATDIVRNFAIAAWAVRRHLDYVARFEFRSCNGDEGLDNDIEELVRIQSRPRNCDRGGRFSREKMFRIAEARRVIDGDTGLIMLQGGSLQGIESDLIRDPDKIKKNSRYEWVDGIEVDGAGLPRKYSIHKRNSGSGYKHARNVDARNFIHYGFFERYASEQIRGISPIIAALNSFRDVYENFDYALAKMKLGQLFGVAILRKADAALDHEFPGSASDEEEEPDETTPPPRELDLSNGPTVLDMEPGEATEVIESRTPSTELQAFSRLMVMVALKSLDIPYSFFDESHTNYSGARGSWLHYERACMDRRDDQIEMRRRWTVFQLQRFILEGRLQLPSGVSLTDLKWQWIPKGMPWWKPSEELTADLKAIGAGLTSPQQVAAKIGSGDVFDNLRETAEFVKFARELGNELLNEPFRVNFDPGPFPSAITDQSQPDA